MKKIFLFLLTVILAVVLVACGSKESSSNESSGSKSSERSEEGVTKIRFGHSSAPDSARDQGAHKFKEVLEAETNGAFEVEIYPANQLGDPSEQIQSVQQGSQEMAI